MRKVLFFLYILMDFLHHSTHFPADEKLNVYLTKIITFWKSGSFQRVKEILVSRSQKLIVTNRHSLAFKIDIIGPNYQF